jgi:hypothetical protein
MVNAANEREFSTVAQAGAGGLLIGRGPFFLSQRRQTRYPRTDPC